MMNAASSLPVIPGEADADVFPLRERLRFRDSFGLALLELRARSPAFRGLARGPWALFIAIAVHWQGNAEAWPSQDTLAHFSGWSTRAVRDQADVLARTGFVRVRRERRADGSERIFYAPGLVTLAALTDFVERFPRERAKVLRRESPAPTVAHPAEVAAGSPPEEPAGELRDQDQREPSSCEAPAPVQCSPRAAEEQQGVVSKEDEEIARQALAERMKRKHPARPAPRWFDAGEVAMVAACAAAFGGDREAKIAAQQDAIAGAFIASKDGAPTVRFVWGKIEHFFDHVERGRRRRDGEERAKRGREEKGGAAAVEEAVPREEMIADLERIFGADWGRGG